ncbi:hypothetical protein RhiXN_07354 [Rhizoctonia solani]|uniref:Uncharacterized protein n=1 Tax=Rhizoctonia solani TaxID=456999 RepID=A0A8H8P528_9AGAM|nr:uncharacterized protein RhiXN_07354 [Rhizoctonia solani]QRW25405.1 hypothetical protein RhiXN_07354 [Rhizoctonia solani]
MAPSTTPRPSLGERRPSPLKMSSAAKHEKVPASPSTSIMDFDGEGNDASVVPRKSRPSGQDGNRPRVRSGGGPPRTAHAAMQSPDVAGLEQLRQTMQATLGMLGTTFDYLGEQTGRVAQLGPAVEASHQIHQLRRQVHAQDRKQEERMQEIKSLLQDVLKDQIAEHLRAHVFEMIREKVEEYVADKVREQLQKQIPDALREQVKDHRRHLAEVKRCLNNSEARRANATLRNHGSAIREPLHALLMTDGNVSDLWPADLAQLFDDTAKRLLDDYELTYASDDPTERMLNKFMAHIGVGFQMVPPQRRPPLQISSM